MWDGDAAQARVALAAVEDCLDAARAQLLAAGGVEWVSEAALRYRTELTEVLAGISGLGARVPAARVAVLRHLDAADAARQAVDRAGAW